MGAGRAVAPRPDTKAGWTLAGSSPDDRRNHLQVPDRHALGAPAGEVRQLAGVYNRLRMWALDGTWERVFTALVAQADADEDLSWAVSVDSTLVRAHTRVAGACKKGPRPTSWTTTSSAAPAAD